jgi:hypothetical protein
MIMLALSSAVQAGVLFSDNFDDHSDWFPPTASLWCAISSRDGNAIRACTGALMGPQNMLHTVLLEPVFLMEGLAETH